MSTIEQYLKPEVIKRIAGLDLKARFIVQGFISGLHASPYHGFSVEFSEHRKYELGDELNTIDWNVYGRTDRFFVKKYRAETNTQCHLVVDVSPSMGYGYKGMTKLEYGICIAAALGFMMIRQQDPVGLVTFDERIRTYVPPKCKRGHLAVILGQLTKAYPSAQTNIAGALNDVAGMLRRRGLVILISDLLAEPQSVLPALSHLRFRQHDVIVFHILDESEVKLPFEDMTSFQDPETGSRVVADPHSVRKAYMARLNEFIESYRTVCNDNKIDYVQLDTSMPFDKALMSFLMMRRTRF
ncbi:MAG: DUF58 domain-containing protein [Planctomycetota bacterium]|nr:DUF58 domain-containing protein [Planctomycetota bacterium]